jgi:hypothetical protein
MTCTCPNPTASSEINKTVFNQTCNETVSIHSCTNTVTLYSPLSVYISTTQNLTVCPTSTTESIPNRIETTNLVGTPTDTYPVSSSISCPPWHTASDRLILFNTVIPAAAGIIGLLVVFLLVVISGWVCTCRIMKKRGKMEINIIQERYCLDYTCTYYNRKLQKVHKYKIPYASIYLRPQTNTSA